jgi:hypothetical protein
MEPEETNPNVNPSSEFSQNTEDAYTIEIIYRSVDYISIEVKVPKDFDLRNHHSEQFPDFDPLDVAEEEFNRRYLNEQASTYWELDEEALEESCFLEDEARKAWIKRLKAEEKEIKKKAKEAKKKAKDQKFSTKSKGEDQ